MEEKPRFRWYWLVEPPVLLAVYTTGVCAGAFFSNDPRLRTELVHWLTVAVATLAAGFVVFHLVRFKLGWQLSRPGLRFQIASGLYVGMVAIAYFIFK